MEVYLEHHKAAIMVEDRFRHTPIHHAIRHDHVDLVIMLLNATPDILKRERETEYLAYAVENGAIECVSLLQNRGVSINYVNEEKTCLHCAIDELASMRQLLENGADVTLRNSTGENVLDTAINCTFDTRFVASKHKKYSIVENLRKVGHSKTRLPKTKNSD